MLYFKGDKISFLEWNGTFVSICGMFLANAKGLYHLFHSDNSSEEAVSSRLELYGSFLCFIAASSEVLVILNRAQISKHVPLMQVLIAFLFLFLTSDLICSSDVCFV